MGAVWVTVVASLLTLCGFTTQNVSIVYWTEVDISQYGVLLFNNLFFPVIFLCALGVEAVRRRDWRLLLVDDDARERSFFKLGSQMQLAAVIGLLNILNGFFVVYASPPTRTPPLIQAILQNAGVVFSIPFSLMWLGDRKNYCAWRPMLAVGLVATSVAVSILPTVLAGQASDGVSASTIPWIFVYLAGLVPGAAYNVLQQRWLIRADVLRVDVTAAEVTRATLRMLFYTNLFQTLSLVALFWMDILPWFGASSSMSEWRDNTVFSLSCSFGGASGAYAPPGSGLLPGSCTPRTPAWAFAFMIGYVWSYVGSSLLNRESATYNMAIFVVITMTTSAFWLIPSTNPNPDNTPLWSVLVSLVLSLSGVVLWKVWEHSVQPAHEQFDLQSPKATAADADGDEEAASVGADKYPGRTKLTATLLGVN